MGLAILDIMFLNMISMKKQPKTSYRLLFKNADRKIGNMVVFAS